MTLLFFKIGLPAILGYTLFIALAGRLNPLARPQHVAERPSWMLGLWVGLAVSGVVGLSFHLAYKMDPASVRQLVIPSASLLLSLLAPAFIVFFLYKRRINNSQANSPTPSFDWILDSDDLELASTFDPDVAKEHPLDIVLEETNAQLDAQELVENDVTAAFQPTDGSKALCKETTPDPICTDEATPEPSELKSEPLDSSQQESFAVQGSGAHDDRSTPLADDARDSAETILDLQKQLAISIDEQHKLEIQSSLEESQRTQLEETVLELKQEMVNAKKEVRRSTAARAKALSTANKSIAFARQTVQIRSRLESELDQAKLTIKNRQSTVGSLIRALEKEKRRSEEDVIAKAKQLILREKQIQAKRSLQGVARSVENKLTPGLVKKVAKARPLISDLDNGKTNL